MQKFVLKIFNCVSEKLQLNWSELECVLLVPKGQRKAKHNSILNIKFNYR